jgi:hypothetical protein
MRGVLHALDCVPICCWRHGVTILVTGWHKDDVAWLALMLNEINQ